MDLKERVYSVLVVSASENFNKALSALLPPVRYGPVNYAGSVGAARRILSERDFDFVLINAPLPDDAGTGLAIDICGTSGGIAVLIVHQSLLDEIRDKVTGQGVFTLRLVNRAKLLLITELKMEEPTAHRFIEKQSMDRCITRREVAEEIIRTYS